MRSFVRVRLLSIVVLGLMLASFSQTAFAYAYAYFTTNGSSATLVTVRSPKVRFDASASQPVGTTYYWEFDDGTTLSTTNPVIYHTFPQYPNATMNYLVALRVYDENGYESWRGVTVEVVCSNYVPGGPPCMD
jgi:hypothetical protein